MSDEKRDILAEANGSWERFIELDRQPNTNGIVRIWCDGRVKVNPGLAGWAALLDYSGVRKLVYGNSEGEILTNNQAQIEAAISALAQLKRPCEVEFITDSQYLERIGNGEWEAKSNLEEWGRLNHVQVEHKVTYKWVKELTSEEQRIVRTKAESMIGKAQS